MNYIERRVINYPRVILFPELFDQIVKEEEYEEIQRLCPKVIIVNKLPFKWTLAINLFGKVYSRRNLNNIELQHELIHSLQMKEIGYIKFYISYVYEWLKLSIKYKNIYKGYLDISFEKEAHLCQDDIHYIINKYSSILESYYL